MIPTQGPRSLESKNNLENENFSGVHGVTDTNKNENEKENDNQNENINDVLLSNNGDIMENKKYIQRDFENHTENDEKNEITIENDDMIDNTNQSARWITDDCLSFLEREIRRKNKYDGLIFDPPAFGRALNGKIWKLEKDLPVLVEELIPKLLSEDPLFVLLSCHDVTWPAERLAETLSVAMSNVMKDTMLKNMKLNKKNKMNLSDKNDKNEKIDKNDKNNRNKNKMKDNLNINLINQKNQNNQKNNNLIQNSNKDIKSVFLAGGILEYGPMILHPKGIINSNGKLEIGNSLPLGCFARWSKIIN